MGYGWRGRRGGCAGPWPGRGPFSYLPPWQRPGRLYGRGQCACVTPYAAIPKEQEISMLENQTKWLKQRLGQIGKRLKELHSERKGPAETTEKGDN